MRIEYLTVNNFNKQNGVKYNREKAPLNFCGITNAAKKQVYVNPELLKRMSQVNDAGIIGTLPFEFVSSLKKAGVSNKEMGEEIKKLTGAFSLAADELRDAEEHFVDNTDEFTILEFSKQLDEALYNRNACIAERLFNKLLFMQASEKTFEPALEKAGAHIDKAFKEAGILPDNSSVRIEFKAGGARGYAFNISFLNNEGEKIFHDKVLKLYRSPHSDTAKKMAEAVYRDTHELSKEEYLEIFRDKMSKYYTQNADKLPNPYKLDKETVANIALDDYMISAGCLYDIQNKMSFEEIFDMFNGLMNEFSDNDESHGVYAEANRAMFLKNRTANIRKTDYIEPCFFNLKKGYCLLEMSDNELPSIQKKINLNKYNLYHSDLSNPDNIVEGRVIDYGGIKFISS